MLFSTAAVYCLIRWREDSCTWLQLAGIFSGLGATTKLTGLWIVAAGALVLLFMEDRGSWKRRTRRALLISGIGILPVLPWFAKTWSLTGNPIYPLFHSLLGGIEFSSEGWNRYQECHLLFNSIPSIPPTSENLMLAHTLVASAGAALAAATLLLTRSSRFAIPLRFAAFLTAGICVGSYFSVRFVLGALPPLAAFLAYRLRGFEQKGTPALCALAILLALRVGVSTVEPSLSVSWNVALGRIRADQYLETKIPDYGVAKWANQNLGPNDRILIGTWEKNTAYYRNPAFWPDYWLQDSIHYGDREALEADLGRLGVTHLVYRAIDYDWCEKSHVCRGRRNAETPALLSLAQRRGTLLYRSGEVSLFALNLPRTSEQELGSSP
jgi:hypothetical protein